MALTPFVGGGNGMEQALWDPLSRMVGGTSLFDPRTMNEARAVANTRVDWLETPEAHIFKADLPGLRKEEVKIEVHDGRVLQISGERRKEEHQDTNTWHRVERTRGAFSRSFRLPENAKIDEIQARIDHGVLTVSVPKSEIGKPEPKRIDISG